MLVSELMTILVEFPADMEVQVLAEQDTEAGDLLEINGENIYANSTGTVILPAEKE